MKFNSPKEKMELFCDPSIFEDSEKVEKIEKVEKNYDFENFDNYVPVKREINWFWEISETSEKSEIDCTDHPDKYVQQG